MSNSLIPLQTANRFPARQFEYEQEPPNVISDILPVTLYNGERHNVPVQLRIDSPSPWQELKEEDLEASSRKWTIRDNASTRFYYEWTLFHGRPREGDMRESMTKVRISVSAFESWYSHSYFDRRWEPLYGREPFSVTVVENRLSQRQDGSPFYGHAATGIYRHRLLWGEVTDEDIKQIGQVLNIRKPARSGVDFFPRHRGFKIEELYKGFVISLMPVKPYDERWWDTRCSLPHARICRGISSSSALAYEPPRWAWCDSVRTKDIMLKRLNC